MNKKFKQDIKEIIYGTSIGTASAFKAPLVAIGLAKPEPVRLKFLKKRLLK